MLKTIEDKMLAQNAQAVKYIKVHGIKDSRGTINEINRQISRDFGLVGPLTLSTPSERVHSIRWAAVREAFAVETNVQRVTKETVAAVIAQINKCPYCEDVHATSISSAGNQQTANAVTSGKWQSLENAKTKAIIEWSLNTLNPNAEITRNPPFSIQEAPEIIGTALVFHSTNRLVSMFLSDSPLPQILGNSLLKKTAMRFAEKTLFKSMVMKKANAGESLKFVENFPVSKNLSWAQAVPDYAKVLSAEEALVTKLGHEIIPAKSKLIFKKEVSKWNGKEMPLGRAWLSEILSEFDDDEKPIANLVFLSAFMPYAVTEEDINDFRRVRPSDKELVETCFWAIQIVVNRITEWLVNPFLDNKHTELKAK